MAMPTASPHRLTTADKRSHGPRRVRYHAGQQLDPSDRKAWSMSRNAIETRCVECDGEFMLPAAERRFRSERGLADPTACPECRSRARSARNAEFLLNATNGDREERATAADHHRHGRARGRNGSGSDGPSQRYPAVCAACGAQTMVPFVPRGDRPVYCRECFNARKGR